MKDSKEVEGAGAPVTVERLVSTSLCYVDRNFAYFTTQPLAKQWGDDWDDNLT